MFGLGVIGVMTSFAMGLYSIYMDSGCGSHGVESGLKRVLTVVTLGLYRGCIEFGPWSHEVWVVSHEVWVVSHEVWVVVHDVWTDVARGWGWLAGS
jgi:hypothetical protein